MSACRVSVIGSLGACGGAMSPWLVALLDQSVREMEIVLALPREESAAGERVRAAVEGLARGDARVRVIEARGEGDAAAWNAGLRAASGEYVVCMTTDEALEPGVLRVMLATAEGAGAYAPARWLGAAGEELAISTGPSGARIDRRELERAWPGPAACFLTKRELLAEVLFEEGASGADHAAFLRVASRGGAWSCAAEPMIRARLGPLAPVEGLRGMLRERLRTLDEAGARAGEHRRGVLAALAAVDASRTAAGDVRTLGEIAEALRRGADGAAAGGPTWTEPRGEATMSAAVGPVRWWARMGFAGRMPSSLVEHAKLSVGPIVGSVERIPGVLLDSCEPGRPIVLLGLGRNARAVAAEMVRRGLSVAGRDDGLCGAPEWARADGVDVRLIGAEEPFDAVAQHVMTVLRDEAYVARLPRGLRLARWSEAAEAVEREALEWERAWPAA
ncbi:MAG: glycosyltransferase [Planctomycetota bacterium]|nr:glycosyltransferase [Planctomycetota bacterium]